MFAQDLNEECAFENLVWGTDVQRFHSTLMFSIFLSSYVKKVNIWRASFSEVRKHQDDEYAWAGVQDPKVMITTSHDPSSRLKQFAKVWCLTYVSKNSWPHWREKEKQGWEVVVRIFTFVQRQLWMLTQVDKCRHSMSFSCFQNVP